MSTSHISCPCINCTERKEACHSKCKSYLRYRFLCQTELKRVNEEKEIDSAVREIALHGYKSMKYTTSEPLKHGRKK